MTNIILVLALFLITFSMYNGGWGAVVLYFIAMFACYVTGYETMEKIANKREQELKKQWPSS